MIKNLIDNPTSSYTGRFAPSPTGPLHFGSLVAAMASYLDARSQQGDWLLRIEDLDPPREVSGAADSIIKDLAMLGFEWDGPIVYQSQRHALYEQAIEDLLLHKFAYACDCSRKTIAEQQLKDNSQHRYPGYCRNRKLPVSQDHAIRVVVENRTIHFSDRLHGKISENLHFQTGDFIVRRKDGFFAYQLAVVIDDAEQGVSHVVRGDDLLDSTARQIHLQSLLGLQSPKFAHTPLVLDDAGNKFSKSSNNGNNLSTNLHSLIDAWHFLRQQPVNETDFDSIADFWNWARVNWDITELAKYEVK